MITIAILALILAFFLGLLWPRTEPAVTCVLIAGLSLLMRFAP